MTLEYSLTYAGVPFVNDVAHVFRFHDPEGGPTPGDKGLEWFGPECDLIDELNRMLPFRQLNEFVPPSEYPGRSLGAVATDARVSERPSPEVKIGEWFYPAGIRRWSVFRGLATSGLVKAMVEATNGGANAAAFVMKNAPLGAAASAYTITTPMFMLPPRPLREHGAKYGGMFLVTLVDERWHLQSTGVSLRVNQNTTWDSLIVQLASALGVTVTGSAIDAVYGRPEPDSQLWCSQEYAEILLDAVALNLGRTVVRNFAGTYSLLTVNESAVIALLNRGNSANVVRTAGGNVFSAPEFTKAGNLNLTKNAVVPSSITVAFPRYVTGDDPVPHFVNARYANQRPSCWYEESHGDTYDVNVTIGQGGAAVAGIGGVGEYTVRSTAKALMSGENQTVPYNASGLGQLALRIAQDYWSSQAAVALDESYPGTYAWTPEGIHDIYWNWSAKERKATTRVAKSEWNRGAENFQHAAPPLSGVYTTVPRGVGGPSVAQTWRDAPSFSGSVATVLFQTLQSGATAAVLTTPDNFPTQNRWKGKIDEEVILFEGTSGGANVNVVLRGIDGTIQTQHENVSVVRMLVPNTIFGTNLVDHEKSQFVFPGEYRSGGIQGATVVPQTQTVKALDAPNPNSGGASGMTSGAAVSFWSGRVMLFDPVSASSSGGTAFQEKELCWLVERGEASLLSGVLYDGQFGGFARKAPIYLVNVSAIASGTAGDVTPKRADAPTGDGENIYDYELPTDDLGAVTLTTPASGDLFIHGLVGGVNGRSVVFENNGPGVITLRHMSPSGIGGNQFFSQTGEDYTMTPGQAGTVMYNTTSGSVASGLPGNSFQWRIIVQYPYGPAIFPKYYRTLNPGSQNPIIERKMVAVRYTTDSGASGSIIDGLFGGLNGRFGIIENAGPGALTLMHNSPSVLSGAGKIITQSSSGLALLQNQAAVLLYNSPFNQWLVISAPVDCNALRKIGGIDRSYNVVTGISTSFDPATCVLTITPSFAFQLFQCGLLVSDTP